MRTVGIVALLVLAATVPGPYREARADELVITVTSTADVLETAACPSATDCTIRKAIETIQADLGTGPYVIVFDPTVFPPATPAAITLDDPLPDITRESVRISGVDAGVILQGDGFVDTGLVFTGGSAEVVGLHLQTFVSSCVSASGTIATIGGNPDDGEGNTFGGCGVAILATGESAKIDGNVIGWDAAGASAVNLHAIEAAGEDAEIGVRHANVIGFAQTGILASGPFAVVEQNIVGMSAAGDPAAVAIGISAAGAGATIGNTTDAMNSNIVGNAATGILSSGADASLVSNLVGFTPAGDVALVGVGIHVTGEDATLGEAESPTRGNTVGNAETGFLVAGTGAVLFGNTAGISPSGDPAPVDAGFVIEAGGVTVGDETEPLNANEAGNASVGILVGTHDGTDDVIEGVVIERNWVGRSAAGVAHPVDTGIEVAPPSIGTVIAANRIANTTGAGIAAAEGDAALETSGVFTANIFQAIGALSIDLDHDGIRNPNDAGDSDTGANGLLNHPVILVATQSEISGTTGPLCIGGGGLCTVALYAVEHEPGGSGDYLTTPIPGATVTTASNGSFEFTNPDVDPGVWVAATVTLGTAGTSEGGPSARVGTGSVECGNVTLFGGWNHVPYLGAEPLELQLNFPPGDDDVSAIFEFQDGEGFYRGWAAGTITGRTLFSLTPGEPYWFHATSGTQVEGGFSVTVPVEVELEEGWNDFVYMGATTDVRDALASIEGKYESVYRFASTGFSAGWTHYAGAGAPAYANDFDELTACSSYWILVTEDTTLIPPHP